MLLAALASCHLVYPPSLSAVSAADSDALRTDTVSPGPDTAAGVTEGELWVLRSAELLSDSCGLLEPGEEKEVVGLSIPTQLLLERAGSSLQLRWEGEDEAPCSIQGSALSCEPLEFTQGNWRGVEASINGSLRIEGSLDWESGDLESEGPLELRCVDRCQELEDFTGLQNFDCAMRFSISYRRGD